MKRSQNELRVLGTQDLQHAPHLAHSPALSTVVQNLCLVEAHVDDAFEREADGEYSPHILVSQGPKDMQGRFT